MQRGRGGLFWGRLRTVPPGGPGAGRAAGPPGGGPRRGTFSTLLYVLLGAIGIPVFANFTGGLGIVLGVTGGFIISFPIMALFAGFASTKSVKNPALWMWLILGALVNYAVGTVWCMFAAGLGSGRSSGCLRDPVHPDSHTQDHPYGVPRTDAAQHSDEGQRSAA